MIQHRNRIQRILILTLMVTFGIVSSANAQKSNKINWRTDYRKAYKESQVTGKPMLIKFTAPWCVFCKKMKKSFADRTVAEQVNNHYIPVIVNADNEKELSEALEVKGLPTTVVLTSELEIAGKIKGFLPPPKLLKSINGITNQFNDEESIEQISLKKVPIQGNDPAGVNKVEFAGVCLVSLVNRKKIVMGDKDHALNYHDHQLFFSSEENKEEFQLDPEKYWPALNGYCPVSAAGKIETKGNAKLGAFYKGKLWFFASRDHRKRFATNPRIYLKELDNRDLLN
jgi:thioredoxin-related protein/YHS domain-containing protein